MAPRSSQPLRDGGEHVGRNGEVIQWTGGALQRSSQAQERLRLAVVAVDVLEARRERREGARVHATVHLEALTRAGSKGVNACRRSRDPDDRHVEETAPDERLQSREDLPKREVARRPEKDEGVRRIVRHRQWHPSRGGILCMIAFAVSTTFSAVKPNSYMRVGPGADAPKRSTPMIAPSAPT